MKLKRPPIHQVSISSLMAHILIQTDPAHTRLRAEGITSYHIDYGINDKIISKAVHSPTLSEQIKNLNIIISVYPSDIDAYYQRAIRHLQQNNPAPALLDLLTILLINNHFNLPFDIKHLMITISPHTLFESIINLRNIEHKITFLSQCMDSDSLLGQFFSKPDESIRAIKLAIINLHLLLTRNDAMPEGISRSSLLENILLKCATKHISEGNFGDALKEYLLVLRQNPNCQEANKKGFFLLELIKRQVSPQRALTNSATPNMIFRSYPVINELSLRTRLPTFSVLITAQDNVSTIRSISPNLISFLHELSSTLITEMIETDDDFYTRMGLRYYGHSSAFPIGLGNPIDIAIEMTKTRFANNSNKDDLHYQLGLTYGKYKKYFEAILHMHAASKYYTDTPDYPINDEVQRKHNIAYYLVKYFECLNASNFELLFLEPLRAYPKGELKTGLLKSIINVDSQLHNVFQISVTPKLPHAAEIMKQFQLILLDADEVTMVKHSARMFAQVFRQMPILTRCPDEVGVMIAARTIEYETISGKTSEKIAASYFGRPVLTQSQANRSPQQLQNSEKSQTYEFFRRSP